MSHRFIPVALLMVLAAQPTLAAFAQASPAPTAAPSAVPSPRGTLHPRMVPTFAPTPTPTPKPTPTPFPRVDPNPASWQHRNPAPAVTARHGAVSSVSGIASKIGVDVMKKGGNAVDAAIAVAFALAVVYPEAGNIGGGGFMVVRLANGESAALDYRETAPARASRNMYLDVNGNLTDKSTIGALAAGVPGTVAGMEAAHKRYGKLAWAELVNPAVQLAEKGFVVNDYLAKSMSKAANLLVRFPETRRVLMPGGRTPQAGQRLRQPDLANTLKRIAREGAKGFYHGPVADALAADQARTGGIITKADLAAYKAIWRTPVTLTYRGNRIITMPPPSSGGVTLAQILNILEGYDLKTAGWHSPQHIHWMIEANRRAYADRNTYLGDPDFVKNQPLGMLMSKPYAERRRATIKADVSTPEWGRKPGLEGESEQTTHYSVVDRWGNAVSNTYTLNGNFGSGVVAKGTGVLLNNEMDDFAAKPGTANMFGLVQGERNAIAPGKRMLSSMTPAIVLDPQGKLSLVVGSPGGSTIITTVMQVITNVYDFGFDLNLAVAAPRVHHQGLPDILFYEPGGLSHEVINGLVRYGHQSQQREKIGDVEAIRIRPDGVREAVADPRRQGEAAGY